MVEEKDIDIQYIWSEENQSEIITNNTLEAYFARYTRRITDGELWELVDTRRGNIKNTGVMDDIITRDKTEYSSYALAEVLYGIKMNE